MPSLGHVEGCGPDCCGAYLDVRIQGGVRHDDGQPAPPPAGRVVQSRKGDGKKTGKAIAKGAKAAAPYVSAASDTAIIAGTVSGQPEVVALGAAGKAASKLAGAGKKSQMTKANRYRFSSETRAKSLTCWVARRPMKIN
jgi:hypothetical protein